MENAHANNKAKWATYNAANKALKQQLLGAFNKCYYIALRHKQMGYTTVTTRQIIEHITNTYGLISQTELKANKQRLCAPYNPALPIEELFHRIKECAAFAMAAINPFSKAQICAVCHNLLNSTGVFPEAGCTWRNTWGANKDWDLLKDIYTAAHIDYTLLQTTAQLAGYHAGNAAAYQQQHIATISAQDLAQLCLFEHQDAPQKTNAVATLTNLQQMIKQMQDKYKERKTMTQKSNNTGNKCKANNSGTCFNNNNYYYCWMHSYNIHNNHTSASCKTLCPGH